MATIAELQIKVDTTQLEKAKKLLAELPSVSQKVAQATKSQAEGMQQAEASSEGLSRRAETLIRQTKELEATYKQGRAAVLDYRSEQENVANVIRPMTDSIRQQEAAIRANTEAKKAQMEVDRAVQKSIEGLDTARYNMIQSLQQEIATFGMSREEMLLWEASLIGAKDQVAPLVQELQRLKAAKEEEAASGASGNNAREKEKTSREAANAARREEIALIEQKLREQQRLSVEAPSDAERDAARERAVVYKQEREDLIRLNAERKKLRSSGKLDQNETAKLRDEYVRLRGQLDPTEKAFERLGQQMDKLRKMKAQGVISVEEFKEAESLVERNATQLERLSQTSGKTAKEINFAMRGLPSQFTDIAVSLQGGQRPLTVFLQQGGQIKDMFGGIGPALRAMGSYILGLINPFTVLAGVLGGYAYLITQAQNETNEFNKTLIITGGTLGSSTSQLREMVGTISDVSGTSFAAAQKVLHEVARGSTEIKANLEDTISATVLWARVTGQSTDEVLSMYQRVSEAPLEALMELNKESGLFTTELYNQAAALVEQGKQAQAVALIQNEMNRSLIERSKEAERGISTLAKAWRGVRGTVSDVLQGIKDVFQETDRSQTRALEISLDTLRTRLEQTPDIFGYRGERQSIIRQIEQTEYELAKIQGKGISDALSANQDYLKQRMTQEAIASAERLRLAAQAARTRVEILEKERAELDKDIDRARKRGTATKQIEAAYSKALAKNTEDLKQAREQESKVETQRDDAATKELLRIRERQAALSSQTEDVRKRGKEELELERMRQMFFDLELKQKQGVLTEDQRSLLLNKEKLLAEQLTTVELEKQVAHNKEIVRQEGYAAALRLKEQADREKYADALLGAGLSDKAVSRMKERNALTREHARAVAKIEEEYRKTGRRDTRDNNLAAENDSIERRRQELENFYSDQDKQQADWSLGARKAFANFLEGGRNVVGMTQNFFTSAFGSIEDSLVNFVTTGKFSFKSLVTSILGDLARMATRIAANQIIMSIIGSFMPSPGANTGNVSAGGINNVGSAINALRLQANGGGWSKGVQLFANGGAFTNSVVSRPTAFGTQSGLGVMGEAGPEAIMPLSRTSDGKLGVHAVGGAGSVVAPVSVVVNVDSGPGGSGPTGQAESTGRAVQMAIKTEVERVISINMKPGGSIWRAMNSR